jgi:hypothetical protein
MHEHDRNDPKRTFAVCDANLTRGLLTLYCRELGHPSENLLAIFGKTAFKRAPARLEKSLQFCERPY